MVVIRQINQEDVLPLVELAREVRDHHIEVLGGYFKLQDDEMEQKCISAWSANPHNICLLVEEGKQILGMILGEVKDNPWLEKSCIVVIHNFGVFKEARGKGVGKKLMDAFYKECQNKKIQEIKLGVFNQNKIAYSFYEKYGFEPQEQKMSLMVK